MARKAEKNERIHHEMRVDEAALRIFMTKTGERDGEVVREHTSYVADLMEPNDVRCQIYGMGGVAKDRCSGLSGAAKFDGMVEVFKHLENSEDWKREREAGAREAVSPEVQAVWEHIKSSSPNAPLSAVYAAKKAQPEQWMLLLKLAHVQARIAELREGTPPAGLDLDTFLSPEAS